MFFDRFCFDIISLLGEYLNVLTFADVEYVMRKVYQHSTHFEVAPGEASVKLLRYDCVESPFTWEAMTAFDMETLDRLLAEKPPQEDDPSESSPTQNNFNAPQPRPDADVMSGQDSFDEEEDGMPPIQMNAGSNLLDLSRMLGEKKKQQEEKKRKVDALLAKKKALVVYNPLVTKEPIESRAKEIQTYKNKISQDKFFQQNTPPKAMVLSNNKTSHLAQLPQHGIVMSKL